MLKAIIFVAIGGAIGSVFRYLISVILDYIYPSQFPLAILIANVIGCFFIGLLYGLIVNKNLMSAEIQLLLITGVCGGFTSYSTFSFDIFKMISLGQISTTLLYVFASLFLGVLSVFIGFYIVK